MKELTIVGSCVAGGAVPAVALALYVWLTGMDLKHAPDGFVIAYFMAVACIVCGALLGYLTVGGRRRNER